MADKNKGGRPPKFKSAVEMQGLINEYFIKCDGEKALDENGEPIFTKYGYLYKVEPKPPTVTGLALALGFNSRQALLNYQGKAEFNDTIMRAKARVEEYAESRLFDKDGANGAKFSLANNFNGWKERQEVDLGNKDGKPFETKQAVDDDEIARRLASLGYKKMS